MTREEYAAQMIGFHAQLRFAKKIKFNRELVPADMKCYHGKLLLHCDSQNCTIDSGRAAGMATFAKE
jgi:hypothetical protein